MAGENRGVAGSLGFGIASARAIGVCGMIIGCMFATSCRDIGTGGTGEVVVPKKTLREIQATPPEELGKVPATAPSTRPSTRAATGPVRDVPLTIEEARQLALRNNLDLRVELISPSIAREQLNAEQAQYEWVFTTDAGYSSSDSPFANVVSEELSGSQSQSFRITPGLRAPLRTGGVINLNVPMDRFETNSTSATLNPSYTSDLAATISQPLLRGGGIDVNAQGIRVAFYGYQQSQARTKAQVIRVLAEADRVYWQLYAARQAVIVRRQEYDLAVAQLERARRSVRAGQLAEVEIVRAQSGVADRVEAIINSENFVREREREFKRLINDEALGIGSPTVIIPSTEPKPMYFELQPEQLVTKAMNQRMELLETELQIAQETANVRVARHEMLPLLSLDYTYNINGLGKSWDDSFSMVRDNQFNDHRAGLRLEIPLGNEAARSRLRQALLRRLQQLATREQRILQIRQEVYSAADRLDVDWQRILAARQRVILAQRLLEVEIRQFEQGLRTSTEVLQAQANLASAQLSEIAALADYQIAQVDIAFATGTILGASNVMWDPTPVPKN